MANRRSSPAHFQSFMKYELPLEVDEYADDEDLDDTTAALLTPQIRLDVNTQRRKSRIEDRHYEEDENESESGCEVDLVFLEDSRNEVDYPPPPLKRGAPLSLSQPRKRSSGSSNGGTKRPKKMYELDVTVYPEAAAARASYENRLRKKAEKEDMVRQLNFYKERNKVLEEENEALKEKLLEYELDVSRDDWLQFFRAAGIRSGHEDRYATIFDENRIKPNMLQELNEGWLREMEVTAVGDILTILRHAKMVFAKTNGRKLHFKSPPLLQRAPASSFAPRIVSTSSVAKSVPNTVAEGRSIPNLQIEK